MSSQYEKDKERLQRYLPKLRGCAGLSAEALGKKLGVSKQHINTMEKRLDKPLTKMQYISIRAVFDDECSRHPENINLRDCYDLVFSDPEFYEENVRRIEYALHQAVEDTKVQKRKNRADAKKVASGSLAGATEATIGIGGVAAATFPLVFSVVPAALGVLVANKIVKDNRKKEIQASKEKQETRNEKTKRASSGVKQVKWLSEAFDTIESKTDES